MILTVIENKDRGFCNTIKDVKKVSTRLLSSDKCEIIVDGEPVLTTSIINANDLFVQLSTKIAADAHYCIITSSNGKYSLLPYSADKI